VGLRTVFVDYSLSAYLERIRHTDDKSISDLIRRSITKEVNSLNSFSQKLQFSLDMGLI